MVNIQDVVKALKWTEEDVKEFERAANTTWNAIASDIFSCTGEKQISGKNVFEIVCDAGHIITFAKYPKEKMERIYNLSYNKKQILRKYCFPYKIYC